MSATTEHKASWQDSVQRFMAARSPRERVMLLAAGVVLLLVLLVYLAILPAWRTLRVAPQEQARLDTQLQRMQSLQAQSAALQKQPRRAFDEAALRASIAPLGQGARLQISGERAELQLQGASPDAVAAWLLRSRAEAGAVVREARLQRAVQGGQPAWNGTLVLELVPR